MLSISVLGLLFIIVFVAESTAMTAAARRVGSARGKLRFGLIASGSVTIAGWVAMFIQMALTPAPDDPAQRWPLDPEVVRQHHTQAAAMALIVGILLWMLAFIIVLLVFNLSVKRTFAPFGALAGVGIITALVGWFGVRHYVCEAFVMPTGSMSPTIDPQDRFVVNKLLSPRRFDLIAYHANDPPENPIYVKRLIALPGERLRFESGDLYINDQKMHVPDVIAGRCRATVGRNPSRGDLYRDGETIQLGPDDYFLLGDDIDISLDSRWQGPSPKSSTVGVVDVIYWPVPKIKIIR